MAAKRACTLQPIALALVFWGAGAAAVLAQDIGQETPVSASAPLSAIDWLSATVKPAPLPLSPNASSPTATPPLGEAPVTGGVAAPEAITTTVLGGPSVDSVGLLPSAKTGYPAALWGAATAGEVSAAIAGLQTEGIPALHDLAITVLLAEADAPAMDNPAERGSVLLARVDKLLSIGALDQAYALIEAAGPATNADLFRRAFDVSLLMGQEDRACSEMRATRGLDIAPQTRVFCAARAGDWAGAKLILSTETALGDIAPVEAELLERFLDPEAFADPSLPAPPKPITPLIWRIYDALGETLPTGTLPIAFAHAEVSIRAGWKAQAEAAERLARAAVLSPNQLLGIFTSQKPSASGGIWDRIAAFQTFDAAITAGDAGAVAAALPAAYGAMKSAELEVAFATLYGEALASLSLQGEAGDLAYELGLLSPAYERLAGDPAAGTPRGFLAGLARGDLAGQTATGDLGRAVAAGFAAPPLPDDLAQLAQSGNVGMGILAAIARIQTGLFGEDRAVTEGLALLRALGLESAARRTALELMILERRG